MDRRLLSLGLVAASVGGCWSEDRIGGVFTQEQLDRIRAQFPLLAPPDLTAICSTSSRTFDVGDCEVAARFGHELFFDASLSSTGLVSCASCHEPDDWYAQPYPLSHGASKPTSRNTVSVVNLAYKPYGTYSWIGLPTAADVITQIALPKAMDATHAHLRDRIDGNPRYRAMYEHLFGRLPGTADSNQHETVTLALAGVFEVYMRQLASVEAPFDRFVAGDMTALTDKQLRGFGVFVGPGLCYECHRGSLFTDHSFRVTGVASTDAGRDGTGAFYTASLRHIEKTGPYMHDGSIATLAGVVEFYRWGGDVNGFAKDPLMVPLDITNEQAEELVAFMTALTGKPLHDVLLSPPAPRATCTVSGREGLSCSGTCRDVSYDRMHCGECGIACGADETCDQARCVPNACSPYGQLCDGKCKDIATDRTNCGGCGNVCDDDEVCMLGCYPLQCEPAATGCNGTCVDTMSDPAHCGGCGNVCPGSAPTCAGGMCKP